MLAALLQTLFDLMELRGFLLIPLCPGLQLISTGMSPSFTGSPLITDFYVLH